MPSSNQPPKRKRAGLDESNSRVRCYHCPSEMLKRNIPTHFKSHHPGQTPRSTTLKPDTHRDGSVKNFFPRDEQREREKAKQKEETERKKVERQKKEELQKIEKQKLAAQEKLKEFQRQKELLQEQQNREKKAVEEKLAEELKRAAEKNQGNELLKQLEENNRIRAELEKSQRNLMEREHEKETAQHRELEEIKEKLSSISNKTQTDAVAGSSTKHVQECPGAINQSPERMEIEMSDCEDPAERSGLDDIGASDETRGFYQPGKILHNAIEERERVAAENNLNYTEPGGRTSNGFSQRPYNDDICLYSMENSAFNTISHNRVPSPEVRRTLNFPPQSSFPDYVDSSKKLPGGKDVNQSKDEPSTASSFQFVNGESTGSQQCSTGESNVHSENNSCPTGDNAVRVEGAMALPEMAVPEILSPEKKRHRSEPNMANIEFQDMKSYTDRISALENTLLVQHKQQQEWHQQQQQWQLQWQQQQQWQMHMQQQLQQGATASLHLSQENLAVFTNQVKEVISPLQTSMEDLSNLFGELSTSNKETQKKTKNHGGKSSHEIAKYSISVDGPRSIQELIQRLPDQLGLHYPSVTAKALGEADGIHCKACALEVCSPLELSPGVLRYDCTLVSVDEKGKITKPFSNLKKKILKHFSSTTHQEKVDSILTECEVDRHLSWLERNQTAGMNCFRNVYSAIKDSHSYKSYSTKIASDWSKKVNVGCFNHSEEFPAKMVTPIYDVLREKMIDQLNEILPGTGRRSPFSIMMDKYTTYNRTLNVVGFNTFMGPRNNKSLRCVFLDGYVVKEHTAIGICASLQESLSKVLDGTDWRNRYLGTVVDGGMLHLNYNDRLDREINPRESASSFFLHLWDSSHLVELAHSDVFKDKQFDWVKKTESVITDMNKDHRWGKDLERIIDLAEEQGERIYKPKLFCKTRWTGYAYDVYKNAHKNFEFMYHNLTDKQDDLVDKIGNATFAVDMSTLTDIYSQQSNLSTTLQSPNLFDWHATKCILKSNEELAAMASALRNEDFGHEELGQFNFEGGRPLLSYTASVIKELESKGEFHNQPMTIRQHHPVARGTREASQAVASNETEYSDVISRSREKAASLLDKLIEKTNNRFQGQQNPDTVQGEKRRVISECMSELFDMQNILQREVEYIPCNALETYSNLAKDAGFLEDTCTFNSLQVQYKEFQNAIHTHASRWMSRSEGSREKRQAELKFYTKLMNGHFGAKDFKDINHLLLTAMIRLSNESQCESMASTIKRVHHNRGALSLEKLAKETFIVRNGPPATVKADPVGKLALNKYFGGGPEHWNFVPKDKGKGLYAVGVQGSSKVITRINEEDSTISFDDYDD